MTAKQRRVLLHLMMLKLLCRFSVALEREREARAFIAIIVYIVFLVSRLPPVRHPPRPPP